MVHHPRSMPHLRSDFADVPFWHGSFSVTVRMMLDREQAAKKHMDKTRKPVRNLPFEHGQMKGM